MHADDGRADAKERLDLVCEFLREIFQLRTKPRLRAFSGPDQLFAEFRQRRALAALGFNQRNAEELGPLLDEVPDMPIGKLGVVRGTGELSGFADFVENTEHHHDGLGAAFFTKSPDGFDLDVHFSSLEPFRLSLESEPGSHRLFDAFPSRETGIHPANPYGARFRSRTLHNMKSTSFMGRFIGT